MTDVSTVDTRCSIPAAGVSVPPRPPWLTNVHQPLPQRPKWLPERQPTPPPQSVEDPATSIEFDDRQQDRHSDWRRDATAFLVSLSLHIMVLLVIWQMFRFVMQPSPSAYVITTEFDTGDGAETELLTMVDSPAPKEQPVANLAAAIDVTDTMIGDTQPGGDLPRVGGGGGVGFFGAKSSANSVVFVVDKSGSMSKQGRIGTAKHELTIALQQLQPHQRFYVIFYNDQMHCMLDPLPPYQLLPATDENVRLALEWMNRRVVASGSNLPLTSLLTALEMKPEVIYFLTDGDVQPATADRVKAENVHGTVIHTLCLSEDYGEEIMQRIAKENRGRYRFVESDDDVSVQAPMPNLSRNKKIAAIQLRKAELYLNNGKTRIAQRWLEKIVKDYPNTPQAREAQKMLKSTRPAR